MWWFIYQNPATMKNPATLWHYSLHQNPAQVNKHPADLALMNAGSGLSRGLYYSNTEEKSIEKYDLWTREALKLTLKTGAGCHSSPRPSAGQCYLSLAEVIADVTQRYVKPSDSFSFELQLHVRLNWRLSDLDNTETQAVYILDDTEL